MSEGMELNVFIIPPIILIVSFLFSMIGLGGAQLYVVILHWLGLDLKTQAIPLSLSLNFITQVSASVTYLRQKIVDFHAATPMVITMILFPFLGAFLCRYLDARTILLIIGMILILVSIQVYLEWMPESKSLSRRQKLIVGLIAGAVVGVIIGLLGHGGGSFVVPMLLLFGMLPKRAMATSSFICSFSTFTGFLSHAHDVTLNWPLVVMGILCAVVGSQLGSHYMVRKLSDRKLKRIFSFILFVIGVQVIFREL